MPEPSFCTSLGTYWDWTASADRVLTEKDGSTPLPPSSCESFEIARFSAMLIPSLKFLQLGALDHDADEEDLAAKTPST